jgi:hypothetical protein
MDQMRFQMELAAFDEKIALAELEESKAAERVKELKYEKARFQMEILNVVARQQDAVRQQAQGQGQVQPPPQKG